MRDRAPRKTPRQRAAFERRAKRVMRRARQRWGHAFKMAGIEAGRFRKAAHYPCGFLGVLLRELRINKSATSSTTAKGI